MPRRPDVLLVSSHVARGSVGNRAMGFALERLGHAVWEVPTVILPHHPGHGPAPRIVASQEDFAALAQALERAPELARIGGIVTGYFATPAQVAAAARLVAAVKRANPAALYLCDPVLGDGDALYVGEAIAEAVRDRLMPAADVATPNAFECRWLAGATDGAGDLAALAARLPAAAVVVTSAPALMRGHTGNLVLGAGEAVLAEHPLVDSAAKGTGDLFAALVLARLLEGRMLPKAVEMAAASVFEIVAGTARAGGGELLLSELQHAITQPRATVAMRRLAPRPSRKPRPLT